MKRLSRAVTAVLGKRRNFELEAEDVGGYGWYRLIRCDFALDCRLTEVKKTADR